MRIMQNKDRTLRQEKVLFVMNGVIVGLCILLAVGVIRMTGEFYEVYSPYYSEDAFHNLVQRNSYVNMVSGYHMNTAEGHKGSKTMQEYYGVAKYYEAASFYKAFKEAGDDERADREFGKLQEALEQMGSWSVAAGPIKEQLGINP